MFSHFNENLKIHAIIIEFLKTNFLLIYKVRRDQTNNHQ